MAVTMPLQPSLWDGVKEMTKAAQDRGTDPFSWAVRLSSSLSSAGVPMPSVEVANILVSHIFWENNHPIAWKFLDKALTMRIVPPPLVLALLSTRAIPSRWSHPAAYRLYLELLRRYAFSLPALTDGADCKKIMDSVDEVLHLSQIFGLQSHEAGILIVEFVFSIVWQLLDASLDDEGLLELVPEKMSWWPSRNQNMDIDNQDNVNKKKEERHEELCKLNTAMAVEIICEFFRSKLTTRILYFAFKNMPMQWGCFAQNLQLLATNSPALRNSKKITPEVLLQLSTDPLRFLSRECKTSSWQQLHAVMASGSRLSFAGQCHGTNGSLNWLPIDLFLEDATDGSQVAATSAAETLTGLVKGLQAVNQSTWQETFLGLWIAALRLVQRERDPSEGPVPRLDTCLCMLLSVTPLAIANIIEEEEAGISQKKEQKFLGKCRKDLVSSLQQLDDYESLLIPPQSVSSLANQAAAKAIVFLSGLTSGSGFLDSMNFNELPANCSGNMRHLIVEACISRNLLDTSAYLWPGYVKKRANQIPRSLSGQTPGWSSLMSGSALTPQMINALISIPASSLAEIEKIYEIAVNGSNDERISAATILCGASLVRGWNIQERTVVFISRLLSPSVPADHSGSESHLIDYAPFLNILLVGISSVDCIQIFSLHGLVPQLAGALMPICEVFGSCAPTISWPLPTGEEVCSHTVFSNAFTLLMKLWRFYQPPVEHGLGDLPSVGSHLTPEYLLLVRNCQLASAENVTKEQNRGRWLTMYPIKPSSEPIFIDSFPKFAYWYRQHQACIASTLAGLVPGTPVHQIVETLLSVMFRKIGRGGQALTPSTSASSNSSSSGSEDMYAHLKLPAWDILESIPYVLDGALTACAHGRLSPRDLTTGLKDLADFLPASLVTIVSYFSAEVTRGIWKPASMNGTDWPSPAANLSIVEQQIKKILAATGVDVPSLPTGGNSPPTLPLPLAALVSLTITYKLDKSAERYLNLVAGALNDIAVGCSWPCMPIMASLWAQKVKRWSDFIIFSASSAVFHYNTDSVVQLLRVCFSTALGLNSSSILSNCSIGALLGHGFRCHCISTVAPGILYLRVHRAVRKLMFLSMKEEIVSLLLQCVKSIATRGSPSQKLKKTKHGMRYGQVSLASSMAHIKVAAALGASLVWMTGGLSLVQYLIKETIPSWFISLHELEPYGGESKGMVAMLGGYALAYFVVLSGVLAWGVDSASPASKRRPKVLGAHLEFVASALDGKISLGCNRATWRAYVSGFASLMVGCTPTWMLEVDVEVLKRLSKGLKLWKEEELALALLSAGGLRAMGAAAELIMDTGY